jgi:hypothetical protein
MVSFSTRILREMYKTGRNDTERWGGLKPGVKIR